MKRLDHFDVPIVPPALAEPDPVRARRASLAHSLRNEETTMAMTERTTKDYELLLDLVKRRASIRKLKPDPIPDEYIQAVLEAGHWAQSGANSQPWEYIVVKDPQIKQDLFRAYIEENDDFIYWMEQQRVAELRHPSFQLTADEQYQRRRRKGWSE